MHAHSAIAVSLICNTQVAKRSAHPPCFLSEKRVDFDDLLRSTLSSTLNISLGINDPAWTQAQLPIKLVGLGIGSACQLAPSAFLASATGTSDTLKSMLPASLHNASIPDVDFFHLVPWK